MDTAGYKVTVRPAVEKDMPYLLELQRADSNALGHLTTTAIREHVKAGHVLIASAGRPRRPIGYVLGRRKLRQSPWLRPITQLCVQRGHRGRGVGYALLCGLLDRLDDDQCGLTAWCRRDLPANGWFTATGWRHVATRRPDNARRRPLLLWRFPLKDDPRVFAMPRNAGHHAAADSTILPAALDARLSRV